MLVFTSCHVASGVVRPNSDTVRDKRDASRVTLLTRLVTEYKALVVQVLNTLSLISVHIRHS